MSTGLELRDETGQRYLLEKQLASGGEGAVYAVSQYPGLVAKLYHKTPTPQTVSKLQAMVRLRSDKLERMTAWPRALLHRPGVSTVCGFLMPKISDCQPIQHLYNPVMRLRFFTRETWLFLITAAMNMAAAFDEVHATGCLVGDVNQSNALVSPKALVWLIDCDSFQVPARGQPWLCEVGVPHFTPPELQGCSFRTVVRTLNHDRYGLAVIIFKLLFMGRHPYSGIYQGSDDPTFEDHIKAYRFGLSPDPTTRMKPSPHMPLLPDVPPVFGGMLRRAFEQGSQQPNSRPTALQWFNALKQFREDVVECPTDAGHYYWRGAGQCVWCRLARVKGGPEYFYGAGASRKGFAVDEAKLQELQRRLAVLQREVIPFNREKYRSPTLPLAQPLPPLLAKLKRDWDTALSGQQAELTQRQVVEDREIQQAQDQYERSLKKLDKEYDTEEQELDESEADAKAALEHYRSDRFWVVLLLVGLTIGCLFVICMGLIHKAFAIIGVLGACGFGVWLIIDLLLAARNPHAVRVQQLKAERSNLKLHYRNRVAEFKEARQDAIAATKAKLLAEAANSPASRAEKTYREAVQAEANERTRRCQTAEKAVIEYEQASLSYSTNTAQGIQSLTNAIQEMTQRCRNLVHEHQNDLQKLQNQTEANAKLRYLRLHSIDEADIPNIGAGRKRVLEANGITTAEDVERSMIRNISGFGDALTMALITWRDGILSRFQLDPKQGVSPSDLQKLAEEYKSKQAALLNPLEQQLANLEQQAAATRKWLSQHEVEFRRRVQNWEQATADLTESLLRKMSSGV
jgi:DNA-binding helix-hairpin-helix protein with protein kinase domain